MASFPSSPYCLFSLPPSAIPLSWLSPESPPLNSYGLQSLCSFLSRPVCHQSPRAFPLTAPPWLPHGRSLAFPPHFPSIPTDRLLPLYTRIPSPHPTVQPILASASSGLEPKHRVPHLPPMAARGCSSRQLGSYLLLLHPLYLISPSLTFSVFSARVSANPHQWGKIPGFTS